MVLLCFDFKNDGADMFMLNTIARIAGKKKGGGIETPIKIFNGCGTKINGHWIFEIEPNLPRVYWAPLIAAASIIIIDKMQLLNISYIFPFVLLLLSLALYMFWTESFYVMLIKHFAGKELDEKIELTLLNKDDIIKEFTLVMQHRAG